MLFSKIIMMINFLDFIEQRSCHCTTLFNPILRIEISELILKNQY